jgi:hypothetical protein
MQPSRLRMREDCLPILHQEVGREREDSRQSPLHAPKAERERRGFDLWMEIHALARREQGMQQTSALVKESRRQAA